jgi:hypothetical protein
VNEIYAKRREQVFPKLAPQQIARLEAPGRRNATRASEVLTLSSEMARRNARCGLVSMCAAGATAGTFPLARI